MNTAFQIFACISMTITAITLVILVKAYFEEVFFYKDYYQSVLSDIREAYEKLEEIKRGPISAEIVQEILADLHNRRFTNWENIKDLIGSSGDGADK